MQTDAETSNDVVFNCAHDIHDRFMSGALQFVSYDDYDPRDDDSFPGNIAMRFGYSSSQNALVRDAVAWLEEQNMIDVKRTLDEDRPETGSQGQPNHKRIMCYVTLS